MLCSLTGLPLLFAGAERAARRAEHGEARHEHHGAAATERAAGGAVVSTDGRLSHAGRLPGRVRPPDGRHTGLPLL